MSCPFFSKPNPKQNDLKNQVHRHHPPLVYGREMGTDPAQAEGAAVCRFEGAGRGGGEAAKAAAEEEGEAAEEEGEAAEEEEQRGGATTKAFAAISYRLPHVSARMVPLLQGFCHEVFGGGGSEEEGGAVGGGAA